MKRGRPSLGERRSVALTMERDDWIALDSAVEERKTTMANYIRELVQKDLRNSPGQVDIFKAIKKAQRMDAK